MFCAQQVAFFLRILVRKCKKREKSEKKTITLYMKNCKKEQFCFVLLVFFTFLGLENPLGDATGAWTNNSLGY